MRSLLLFLTLPLLFVPGCYSPDKILHGRSAIDQQVTSAAIRAAVNRLDLSRLDRAALYRLEVTGVSDTAHQWVDVCLRQRLASEGFQVVDDLGTDRTFLEATVAYAASDLENLLIGVPLYIPGAATSLGDVSLYKSTMQIGRAKLGLLVWDPRRRLIQTIPDAQASRYFRNETYMTLIGPFSRTNLEEYSSPGNEDEPRPANEE